MTNTCPTRRTTLAGLATTAAAAAFPGRAFAQAPAQITYWGFSGVTAALEAFKTANPNIAVNYVNTGLMAPHYEKLRNALKAGSGIPDVAECEYPIVPGFVLAKAFTDLNALGAASLKADYLDWSWSEVSQGGKAYSLPWGAGPMIMLYRQDIFDKYSLKVPTTWVEFEQEAQKLKAATSDVSMTDMIPNSGAWWNALFWQKGSRPFRVDGPNVKIAINDKSAKDVLGYWQGLLNDKLVVAQPMFTQDWFNALDAGKYATLPCAAWLLRRLGANAKQGMGQWRVATLPNWEAGKIVGANWGGSSIAVMEASPNKQAAFEFIKWMLHSEQASRIHLENGLFPVLKQTLNNKELMDAPVPLLGGQPGRRVFVQASQAVDHVFQFSPFQQYVDSVYDDELAAAASGKGTLVAAIDRVQERVVAYANSQGFKVST